MHELGAGSSITGTGTSQFSRGTTNLDGTLYDVGGTSVSGGTANFPASANVVDIGTELSIAGGRANFSSGESLFTDTFTLINGTLAGSDTLTVSGETAWTGGDMFGTGETITNGLLSLTVNGGQELNQRTLTVNGDAVMDGSSVIFINDDATIVNNSLFDIQSDADFGISTNSAPVFHNTAAGTLRKSAGSQQTRINIAVDNDGLVEVTSGTLSLGRGGVSSGDFTATENATIDFAGGVHDLSAGSSITGTGTSQFSGGTTNLDGTLYDVGGTSVSGGTANFPASANVVDIGKELSIAGGRANVSSGESLFTDTFTLINGTLEGSDTLTVSGETAWTGGDMFGTGETITNGLMNITVNSGQELNQRTLTVNGDAVIDGPSIMVINNDGTIVNNSQFDIQSDADFLFNSPSPAAFTNTATGTLRKSGGSDLTLINIDVSNDGIVEVTSGTLRLRRVDNFDNSGAENRLDGGTWIISTSDPDVSAATLAVDNVRVVDVLNAKVNIDGVGASFRNNVVPSDAIRQLMIGLNRIDSDGALEISHGYELNLLPGDLQNDGTLAIGPESTLSIDGNFTQTVDATLAIGLGGDESSGLFGQLDATGNVSLDGTLNMQFSDGFGPNAGQSWTVLDANALNGDFADVNVPLLGREQSLEATNTPTSVVVHALVDAGDLVALPGSIVVPPTGVAGEEATFEYSIENRSEVDEEGEWIDSLYLSIDGQLDLNDQLIARVTHTGGVRAQQAYTETVTAPLPGAIGDYRVIVVTDSRGIVPDTNRVNNVGTSPESISVDVPRLVIGETINVSIANEQEQYYRIDVPPTKHVIVSASQAVLDQVEMFAQFGDVPDRSIFDSFSSDPESLEHQIVLSGRSGAWYLLVHGREGAADGEALSLTTEAIDFDVFRVGLYGGGNVGSVTIPISGVGFTIDTTVTLIAPDGIEHDPFETRFNSQSELFSSFDLTDLAPGSYDVRVDDGARSVVAEQKFEVFDGGEPGELQFEIRTTDAIRPRGHSRLTVFYHNTGDTDAFLPPMLFEDQSVQTKFVDANDQAEVDLLIFDKTKSIGEKRAGLMPNRGVSGGVVPPGDGGMVEFHFKSNQTTPSPPRHEFVVKTITENLDEFGEDYWILVRDRARPVEVDPEAWDVIFDNFVSQVGNSSKSFERAFSLAAAYLQSIGELPRDATAVFAFMIAQANNAIPGGPLAASVDAAAQAPGLPLVFGRAYQQAISSRFADGIFGRGWSHPFQLRFRLVESEEIFEFEHHPEINAREVIISGPNTERIFERHERRVLGGGYEIVYLERGGAGEVTYSHIRGTLTASLREPDGTLFRFFGPEARLSHIFDTNDNEIKITYTGDLITNIAHSNGDSFTLEYNAQDHVERLIDEKGDVTTYTYDRSGEHLIAVDSSLGTSTYTYETNPGASEHALTSVTDQNGLQSHYEYDEQGRVVQTERTNGLLPVAMDYNQGRVSYTDANQISFSVFYNAFGQVARTTNQAGQVVEWTFGDQNFVQSVHLPDGLVIDYDVDDKGFVRKVTNPDGSSVDKSLGFTKHIFVGTVFGEDGSEITFNRELRLPEQLRTTRLGDQLDRDTLFEYDANGNLTKIIYPDGGEETFPEYDAIGNLVRYQNGLGHEFHYSYDTSGRLLSQTLPDGLVDSYTYDETGNLISASDERGTTTLEYNTENRLTKVTYPNGRSLQYDYGPLNRLIRLSDQDGNATNYEYDELGRLDRMTDDLDALIVEYTYDVGGRVVREERGNGTFTTYDFDQVNRLLNLTHHAPDGSINSRFDYTYDNLGQRETMTTLDGEWTYEYDVVGQLTSAIFDSTNPAIPNQSFEYQYDAAGNRTRVVENGVEAIYGVNSRNQYTTVGDKVYSYDADGNLVSIIDGTDETTFTYDVQGRLIGVTSPEGTWTYEYDVLGNRVATVHNGERIEYLVHPVGSADVIAEYDSTGNLVASYAYGTGLEARTDANSNRAYYDFNAIGSTVGLSDASGNYVNQYRYEPFGDLLVPAIEGIDNPFGFVGQFGVMAEDNGMEFMRARYYSPDDGRFVSEDPIRHSGGLNLYSYTGNHPTGLIDPSGTAAVLAIPLIGVVGAAAIFNVLTAVGVGAIIGAVGAGIYLGIEDTEIDGEPVPNPDGTAIPGPDDPTIPDGDTIPDGTDVDPVPPDGTTEGPGPNDSTQAGSTIGPTNTTKLGPKYYDLFFTGLSSFANAFTGITGFSPSAITNSFCEIVNCPFAKQLAFAAVVVVESRDPNDIIGPAGHGENGFITGESLLPYTIRFENVADAGGPAAEVRITQQLDDDLDWKTFELGDLGFNDFVIDVPSGRDFYSTRIDATSTLGVYVDVEGGIDYSTGTLSWHLTALDPETLDVPISPFVGLLPPNQTAPEGEGFVSYLIETKRNLPTGTRIDAEASIIFDFNDPIETPPIYNTIDADPPSSSVDPLPETVTSNPFTITWSGADEGGSGIASYDVYMSVDGGDFELLLDDTTETSTTITAENGRTYSFYTVARDNVGHTETQTGSGGCFHNSRSHHRHHTANGFDSTCAAACAASASRSYLDRVQRTSRGFPSCKSVTRTIDRCGIDS